MKPGTVITGRTPSRRPIAYCHGCKARVLYGDPNPNGRWASRLQLDPDTVNLILLAAAEFDQIAASWDDHPSAVEFTDWLAVDALRTGVHEAPYWDGAPPRNLAGEVTNGSGAAHRHPDPLPFAPIRRTRP